MGRSRNSECYRVAEIEDRGIVETLCKSTTLLHWSTELESKVTCKKCVEILAQRELATIENPLRLGERMVTAHER